MIHLNAKSSASQAKFSANRICGIYEHAHCHQTTNQLALWIKRGDPREQSLYIVISLNINQMGSDRALVSSSIDGDAPSMVAILPMDWQSYNALDPKTHDVMAVNLKNWVSLAKLECMIPFSEVAVDLPRGSSDIHLLSVDGLREDGYYYVMSWKHCHRRSHKAQCNWWTEGSLDHSSIQCCLCGSNS